jgi:uncharacterized protein YwgA
VSEKNIEDRVVNNLLLLYLINKADEEGVIEDNIKLQKSVFLTQKNFIDKKMKGFSYNFFRWHHGPFSADVNNDLISLKKNKLVKWEEDRIYLTDEGKSILAQCEDLFEENDMFSQIINEIIEENIKLTPDQIKEKVYNIKLFVPKIREIMAIKDIPLRKLILFKPSRRWIRRAFEINEEMLATLEIIFDEEALDNLSKAYGDAINGRVCEAYL